MVDECMSERTKLWKNVQRNIRAGCREVGLPIQVQKNELESVRLARQESALEADSTACAKEGRKRT